MPSGYRKDGSKLGFQKGHPSFVPKGEKNPKWNGGIKFHDGYVLVRSVSHPFCNSQGYVRKHRLVMEFHLGRYLKPEEIVHHEGTKYPLGSVENKQDNRIENLKLFKNSSEHMKLHYPKGKNFCGQGHYLSPHKD